MGLAAALSLAAGLLPGISTAAADATLPRLVGGVNAFASVGSGQQLFVLDQEVVLKAYSESEDAHLVSEGRWAALVIQRVAPERTVTTAFVGLADHVCDRMLGVPPCTTMERDIDWFDSEYAPGTQVGPNPTYLLRPGTYVVAVLSEPGASTSAWINLSDPVQPLCCLPGQQALNGAVAAAHGLLTAPRHQLKEPTTGAFQFDSTEALGVSTGWSGSLQDDLAAEGAAYGGLAGHWKAESNFVSDELQELHECLEYFGGSSCGASRWDRYLFATAVNLVAGEGVRRSPAGPITYTWEWTATTNFFEGWAWLLSWPFVT